MIPMTIEDIKEYKRNAVEVLRNNAQYATAKAVELVFEKQIPKKPYKQKEGKEINYYCPCKHYLGDETEIRLTAIRPVFCDKCGQALDWSGLNE